MKSLIVFMAAVSVLWAAGSGVAAAAVQQTPGPPALPFSALESDTASSEESEWEPAPDRLRPGRSLFDLDMRPDCSVRYRDILVQPRTASEYGEDGRCEHLPLIQRSPSGRWVTVHTPLNHYGYGQVAVIDAVAQKVAVPPREIGSRRALFPVGAWSTDENLLMLKSFSSNGPAIGELYQFSVEAPCVFNVPAGGLICIEGARFSALLQATAVGASSRAQCLARRTCYLVMAIQDARPVAEGFALTGMVQLKSAARGMNEYDLEIASDFEPGHDLIWFEASATVSGTAVVEGLTLRVIRP